MTKAGSKDAVNRDALFRNDSNAEACSDKERPLAAEAKVRAHVWNATTFSQDMWAKPARSDDDVKLRAELCAYWTGGSLNKDGNLKLPDLKSKDLGRRAVAELIAAVLVLDR